MAYSTTKDFTERNFSPCRKRSDAALKHYESTTDSRAWSNDRQESSSWLIDIIKRCSQDCSAFSISLDANNLTKDELMMENERLRQEIKKREEKIDELHELHNVTKQRLDESVDISGKQREQYEHKYRESLAKIEKLEESVTVERKSSQEKLNKMSKIESLLDTLKSRAREADAMQQELTTLRCELDRIRVGGVKESGDDASIQPTNSCNLCCKLTQQLNRIQACLEDEVRRSCEIRGELNFLRERARTFEVAEAELNFYKIKHGEAEDKISKLKEMLGRNEMKLRQTEKQREQLLTAENNLEKSERYSQQLIGVVERQEIDLREKEIYIETLVRRSLLEGQKQPANPTIAPASSYHSLQPGKVQSIVQQMSKSGLAAPLNCKCGFGDCQCAGMVGKASTSTKLPMAHDDDSIQRVTNLRFEGGEHVIAAPAANDERNRYELEIQNLSGANDKLKSEMAALRVEYAKLSSIVQELEKEREKNQTIEQEIVALQKRRESELSQQMSSFEAKMCAKDGECQQLQEKLRLQCTETADLECKWKTCCKEIKKLKKLEQFEQRCDELQSELEHSREFGLQQLDELHGARERCQTHSCELERFSTQIKCLELQLDVEMKKSCHLERELSAAVEMAKQLQQQQQSHESKIASEVSARSNCSKRNHELLINAIKDMKKRYDAVKKNEIELVHGYERRMGEMQTKHCEEIERIKCSFKDEVGAMRNCTCEWSTNEELEEDEDDVLIRKLHKFGIQSLTADELHDLHSRVRCAMMEMQEDAAAASTNAGGKSDNNNDAIQYCKKICEELKAKYNLADGTQPFLSDNFTCSRSASNLQYSNIPVRDTDLASTRTAPLLGRLSRDKSPCGSDGGGNKKKKAKQRRAKSSTSAVDKPKHGEKSVKCVTITSLRNLK